MQQFRSPRRLTVASLVALSSLGLFAVAQGCNKAKFKGDAATVDPVVTREFTQVSVPVETSSFTQLASGESRSEDFEQGEWGKLDLLVVIDNSGSMTEEQENLAARLNPLLSKVEKSDWQIAVVTTDPRIGGTNAQRRASCQRELIKKGSTFVSSSFSDAIKAGINGTGVEQGILQAVRGLGGDDCTSIDWVRPDSTLAVLIVSDEDNCQIDASGYGCAGDNSRYAAYLTDYLAKIRTIGTDARVYGIIWNPNDATCKDALGKGVEYAKAVQTTGGTIGSICATDYTSTLTKISEDVAKILKYEFDLTYVPDDNTLKITVDGKDWQKYVVNGQKVKFTEAPPFGAKVDVSYKHGANGKMITDFKLPKPADGNSIKVTVNGTEVKSGYTWDAKNNRLQFETAPVEKAAIKIEYQEKDALEDTFDIGKNADPSTMSVTVNGQATTNFEYQEAEGTVRIAPAPAAGALVKISFKEKRS